MEALLEKPEQVYSVTDARDNFKTIIDLALAGTDVGISRNNKIVVKVTAYNPVYVTKQATGQGILKQYANSEKIALEHSAWADAVESRYANS